MNAEYLSSMAANLSKFELIGIGDTDLDLESNGDFVVGLHLGRQDAGWQDERGTGNGGCLEKTTS